MARQSGFTLIEIMVCIVVVSLLTLVVVSKISTQQFSNNLEKTRQEMTAISRIASDYRRLGGATGEVSVAILNNDFDTALPLKNPWGNVYKVTSGPVSAVVETIVPADIQPPGFRATQLSGSRTRIEMQYIGRAEGRNALIGRYSKSKLYLESSR